MLFYLTYDIILFRRYSIKVRFGRKRKDVIIITRLRSIFFLYLFILYYNN